MDYGDLRVPALNYREKIFLTKKYLPGIDITDLDILNEDNKEYYIHYKQSMFDKIDNYAVKGKNNELYLNIPDMAADKDKLFKHILPPEIVEKYRDDLDAKMKSGERPNIIEYFIKAEKEDVYFFNELNGELDDSFKLDSPETILNKFISDVIFYWYPKKKPGCKKPKDQYWTFSDFKCQHSETTIIQAFRYFAQKWCTLYFIGADFIKFKNERNKWPSVTSAGFKISLPQYLSEDKNITKGLGKAFENLNTGDFIPFNICPTEWDELASAKYLLQKMQLNTSESIFHKDICYSFCITYLYNQVYSDYNKAGNDIIKNILLRRLEDVGGIISKNTELWEYKINYFLEGTSSPHKPERGKKRVFYKFSPFKFEIVMQKAWGLWNGFYHAFKHRPKPKENEIILTETDYIDLHNLIITSFEGVFYIIFGKHKRNELLKPKWKKFLQMINKTDVNSLLEDLHPYLYLPSDKQQRTKLPLFRNYCRAMEYDWDDPKVRSKKHTPFQRGVKIFVKDVFNKYDCKPIAS